MPWEDAPYNQEDLNQYDAQSKAKPKQAIRPTNARMREYVRAAFADEIAELSAARPGVRNDQLNVSAFKLGQLVGANALGEAEVRDALYRACQVNGHLADDGQSMVMGTITSGITAGIAEPRSLDQIDWHQTRSAPAPESKDSAVFTPPTTEREGRTLTVKADGDIDTDTPEWAWEYEG